MLVFDLETNGLLDELTTIHTIRIKDRTTGRRYSFNGGRYANGSEAPRDGSIADGVAMLAEAETIGGHNVIAFDVPAIQKLFPEFKPRRTPRDSLIIARLIWTDVADMDHRMIAKGKRPRQFRELGLIGLHSLEAWGYRMGNYKGDYKGPWDAFTREMDEYGGQDVEVTDALFDLIERQEFDGQPFPADAVELELRVQEIITRQMRYGVMFDREAAERLAGLLTARAAELADQLRAAFPPWYEPEKKNGQLIIKRPERRRSTKVEYPGGEVHKVEYVPNAEYCLVKLVSFEPSSRQKIADRLSRVYGWEPQEFTEGGQAKVDETTLGALPYPEAKLLIEYLTVDKRLGQVSNGKQAWLKAVDEDGRIRGRVNTLGARTHRMTHSKPNLAQVPKVLTDKEGKPLLGFAGGYGYESRSLFTVAKGKLLVGVDAEGLELREKAHFMFRFDGGDYVNTVVNGKKSDGSDVHTVNQKFLRLNSRDNAKTWIYAYLYGAGNWKLGMTIYEDMTDAQKDAFHEKHQTAKAVDTALSKLGSQARRRIEEGLPALGKLQEMVKGKSKRGYLKTHDGRPLRSPSEHSALNTLLQGSGAIVMKRALVILDDALQAAGFAPGRHYEFVLNIHDEYQIEADEDIAEEIGKIGADAIRQAGEYYGLNCPLAGSTQIGRSWADSH